LVVGGAARADECAESAEDWSRLHDATELEVHRLKIWSWSWSSIYAVAGITQVALAYGINDTASDTSWRTGFLVGAVSAGLGSLSLLILPLRFTAPLQHLLAHWEDNPDRCKVLKKVASDEALTKSWVGHAGVFVANAAVTLLLGIGFHRWQAGFVGGAIGLALGELNLLTEPTHLQEALEGAPSTHIRIVPMAGAINGAGLVIDF
jgi:hypothetical protein